MFFQNAYTCITYGKKQTFKVWCSIHAFNARFIKYFYASFTYGKSMVYILLCIVNNAGTYIMAFCFISVSTLFGNIYHK